MTYRSRDSSNEKFYTDRTINSKEEKYSEFIKDNK